jgi:hypothetical protein
MIGRLFGWSQVPKWIVVVPSLLRCAVMLFRQAVGVVQRDRPKRVDGHRADRELILANRQAGVNVDVVGFVFGESAPTDRRPQQVPNRVYRVTATERPGVFGQTAGEDRIPATVRR